jgi:hypothetical protein
MASGHEYRTRRPNTWLLRPTPQVKILLANPEPSTHGSQAKSRYVRFPAARSIPDFKHSAVRYAPYLNAADARRASLDEDAAPLWHARAG